jgi:hypothetical protein
MYWLAECINDEKTLFSDRLKCVIRLSSVAEEGAKIRYLDCFLLALCLYFVKKVHLCPCVSLSSPDQFHETCYEHHATKSSPDLCNF